MKFAVYVIVVEDTEENDRIVGSSYEEVERIAGDLTYEEAQLVVQDAWLMPGANSRVAS